MKNIYLIVGPSGVGKTTVVDELNARYGYTVVSSYTDRPPRYSGETGHVFVSPEEFNALGEMCAYTVFDGHQYGVTPDMVDKSDLYVIDPDGVEYLKEKYSGKGIRVIGLLQDKATLTKRMKNRGDSNEKITRRLDNDAKKFERLSDVSDVLIKATDVETTVEHIRAFILEQEKS